MARKKKNKGRQKAGTIRVTKAEYVAGKKGSHTSMVVLYRKYKPKPKKK